MIDLDGFILAGGAASRMGTRKDLLTIGGRSFIVRASEALMPVTGGRVAVVGNIGSDECARLGLRIVPDLQVDEAEISRRRGPIIGVYTALSYSNSPWTVVLACDLPFVSPSLFARLTEFCTDDSDAVVPVQTDGRLQPLCALYRRETCLPVVDERLRGDNWSLNGLLDQLTVQRVEFDQISDLAGADRFFININTQEDHEMAGRLEQ
ncbi:MAG TPA: molybdenum cofactor guanylyltransferase [Pyrinomonadaceae bacterium]|jgi:molybdopterin-guanine dinucleotide biosynthesis protein A|nr:molybdenum cofactor guanylyltransferase [Pyrinomonadaceae bacterium]